MLNMNKDQLKRILMMKLQSMKRISILKTFMMITTAKTAKDTKMVKDSMTKTTKWIWTIPSHSLKTSYAHRATED
jgi:hypothetical protein